MKKQNLKKILLEEYAEPSVYAILSGRKIPRYPVMIRCYKEEKVDFLAWEDIAKWLDGDSEESEKNEGNNK